MVLVMVLAIMLIWFLTWPMFLLIFLARSSINADVARWK
jgi:hypothetical protein